MITRSTDEHPMVVFGYFLAVGFQLFLVLGSTRPPWGSPINLDATDDRVSRRTSDCRDDYRPAPPSDGAWCGVHLDERFPLREVSFEETVP